MTKKEAKIIIRNRMKIKRNKLALRLYRKWCKTIMKRCVTLKEWKDARTVHIYVSAVNNEVDTIGLLYTMFDKGKMCVVPKCLYGMHRLLNINILSLDELVPSKFGIMEPEYNPEKEIKADAIDMVIVPLLAFDRDGGRVGFGGGFYDSLLSECSCPKIGLAFSFQEIKKVPTEPHDQSLDIIITEKEIIRANEG